MLPALSSDEITLLRSLAARGDKVAEILMRAFDTARGSGTNTVVVRVASTANLTLSGAQTIDSVSAVAGDMVLVKNQSTGSQNGIYVIAAGAWSRLIDDQGSYILKAGMLVEVTAGTIATGTLWTCTNVANPVVGTDAVTFGQLVGALSGGSVSTASLAANAVTAPKLAAAVIADIAGLPTFVVGAESSHARVATITLKDVNGAALSAVAHATLWVSDSAGGAPSGTPPSSGTSVGTGTTLKVVTTAVLLELLSNSSGVIAVTVTEATAKTFYVNVAIGTQIASAALVFAG